MDSRPPLAKVALFAAVVRHGSFSKTARELGISTSAVSQSVRALERQLGVVLLVRGPARVEPTEAGRALAERAASALGEIERALEDTAAEATRVAGTLRITAPRVALELVLRPVLGELSARHPQLRVEASVDDRILDLAAEGFDLGIRLDEMVPKDFVAVRISRPFRLLVVGSPDYLRAHGRPRKPSDLLMHDCIGFRYPSGAVYVWELERGRKRYRITPRGRFVSNDAALMVDAAREGRGLACVLEPSAAPFIASGELEIVLEAWAPPLNGFFACFPVESRRSPKVRAFLEIAKERVA